MKKNIVDLLSVVLICVSIVNFPHHISVAVAERRYGHAVAWLVLLITAAWVAVRILL